MLAIKYRGTGAGNALSGYASALKGVIKSPIGRLPGDSGSVIGDTPAVVAWFLIVGAVAAWESTYETMNEDNGAPVDVFAD